MSNPYAVPENQETPQSSAGLQKRVRGLQVMVIALAAGATVFMGIVLGTNNGALAWEPNPVSWTAIGFAIVTLTLHFIVPGIVSSAALNRIEPSMVKDANEEITLSLLFPVFQQRCIMACALLEGAAFFNLIAYKINSFAGSLAVAVFLIVLIAIRFPSVMGVQSWVQNRVQEIEMKA